MVFFEIGCNFDYYLIDRISKLNEISNTTKVVEFYGSDFNHAFLTARPAHRLPKVNKKYIRKYIKQCIDVGISFNYSFNSMYPGSKRFLISKKKEIIDFVTFLDGIGVKTITITNPIIAEIIREASENICLGLSTIAHIDTITQIKYWNDHFNISKICGNLLKNRSINFLKKANTYCNKNDIILSLMVNEFCSIGDWNKTIHYTTHCIYRDSCYLCHSENVVEEDDLLFNSYPMNHCILSKNHPYSWLKSPFIRPEDINSYTGIGINYFKITGRTGSTNYILKITESYIKRSWEGNLLSLWKPLETIFTNEDELTFNHARFIDNKKLLGFLDFWFKNENHDCANEVCGETCNYCSEFYEKYIL